MQDHPGHLVVKFSTWESSPSSHGCVASSWTMNSPVSQIVGRMTSLKKTKRSKNSTNKAMLRANEKLETGSTYYLLPLAEEEEKRKKLSFKSLKNFARVGSSFEYEFQNDSPSPEKKLKSSRPSRSMPARPEAEEQRQQPQELSPAEERRVMKSNSLGELLMENTGREHCLPSLYQPSDTGEQQQQPQELSPAEERRAMKSNSLGELLMENTGREHCLPSLYQPSDTGERLEGERRRSKRSRRRQRKPAWIPVLDNIPESLDEG